MNLTLEQLRDKANEVGPVWLYYPDEYECLAKYASQSNGPILEVGVGFGGSAVVLTLSSELEAMVSVDPFGEMIDGMLPDPNKVYEKVTAALGDEWRRWTLWQTTSQIAALSYKAKTFSLVFIDGDHAYESVKQDVELWLPKIKRSGVLILHDSQMVDSAHNGYGMGWDGPTRLARELRSDDRVEYVETAYSMTVWRVK